MKTAAATLLATLSLVGVGAASDCERLALRDATAELGLDFEHDRGAGGAKHLPETMGAGLAWLDYDGDGWLDLYLVQSGPFPPYDAGRHGALWRNLAGGRFEEVTDRATAAHGGYGQGALAGDLDGDGDVDLVITSYGRLEMLTNDGSGAFSATALGAGATPAGDPARGGGRSAEAGQGVTASGDWHSSAAAADADLDGDLDLYVSRYVDYEPEAPLYCGDPESGERRYCDPSLFEGVEDLFLVNTGGGRFEDRTREAGVGGLHRRGLGALFADLDDDLLPEIYVANDLDPNTLLRNLGDGTFEDVSLLSGAAVNREGKPEAGMGVALGDHNGDLKPDLMVTNFDVETNTYYEAGAALSFVDRSAASGFGIPSFNYLAFGIVNADLDGDGRLDAYVANGHIFERPRRANTSYRQRDQVLLGRPGGGFGEIRCEPVSTLETVARGLAQADLDNDGDPDLAVQQNGGRALLLRNERRRPGWLGVALRGRRANTEGVGARVVLAAGGEMQARWVLAGDSYQSTSDRRVLFARDATSELDTLEIRWPRGRTQRFVGPPADRYLVMGER